MVKKVFWDDPYLDTLQTEVKRVVGDQITLYETIFFAQFGGQESDSGSIGIYPVYNARVDGDDIVYTVPLDHNLGPGKVVTVSIDWARRYKLMRLHFATEVVLQLAYKHMKRPRKIGAHVSEDKARIDFQLDYSVEKHLDLLSAKANQIVLANYAIESGYSDPVAGRRFWRIPGFADVPSSGTLLRRTNEVGLITLARNNIGKNKERIEVTVG